MKTISLAWAKFIIGVLVVIIATSASSQQVFTLQNLPDPKKEGRGYVSDPVGYLSPAEESTLNQLIAEVEDSMTAQIAVVIVPSIGEQSPKEFATALFNQWGIGQKELDNGLLILAVIDQRRTEFETGYGLEGVLPDVYCYRIGMQELVPHFKNDEYGKGLIAAVEQFKAILESPAVVKEVDPRYSYSSEPGADSRRTMMLPAWLFIYLLINLLFHIYLISKIIHIVRSKDECYDKYMGVKKTASPWFLFPFPLPYLFVWLYSKRLMGRLRDMPRYSRVNGKLMHKLPEAIDDRLLVKGQIIEEEVGSVDYDVWVTPEEDDILILRYDKPFNKYADCPACGYKTYRKVHSEVTEKPTYSSSGTRENTYLCKNCNHVQVKAETIPMKQRSGSGHSFGGSSGGGGGSGSSSWGGGSSGGGGAGVSW